MNWQGSRGTSAVLIVSIAISCSIQAQVTTEDISRAIPARSLTHPYLFFTEEEKPAIQSRIKYDPASGKVMAGLLAQGFRYVRMPFLSRPATELEHPRFDREGNEAREYMSMIVDGMMTCAFLYQMTGEEQYARRGAEFAMAVCDLPEWVGGAHRFDIIYPRVWPWNVPDDQVVFSFDISAAGKASSLATAYDWLYPALTKHQRDKIRGALLEKAITRVRGNDEFFWWSTAYRCNWSAICYSGLGVAALALLGEHPQLADVVALAYNRISRSFDEIDPDGGWQEGRGYYSYMLHESVEFMDALKRATRGRYDLFRHSKIAEHPIRFLLYAQTASFGDSDGSPSEAPSMVNKLVAETQDNEGAWYRKTFLREGSSIYDILWPTTDVSPIAPKTRSKHFRGIDWAILGTDFTSQDAMTVACKAGMNNDPHHGHLDCGSFILTWNGVPFIRDIGKMEYDEFYFNEDRYDYLYGSSVGHNVIHVNGETQDVAKKKNSPWKESVGGKIVEFRTSPTQDYVRIDATKAYPGKELKKWKRSIILAKPSVLLVVDEVGTATGADIRSRLFPAFSEDGEERRSRRNSGEIALRDANTYATVSARGKTLAMIPAVLNAEVHVVAGEAPNMQVTKDAQVDWIPYWESQVMATSSTTMLATLFVPVETDADVETLARAMKVRQTEDGSVEVRADVSPKPMVWQFRPTNEGYVLNND